MIPYGPNSEIKKASAGEHIHDVRSECIGPLMLFDFWPKTRIYKMRRIEMKSHIETKLGLIQLDH